MRRRGAPVGNWPQLQRRSLGNDSNLRLPHMRDLFHSDDQRRLRRVRHPGRLPIEDDDPGSLKYAAPSVALAAREQLLALRFVHDAVT